MLEGIPPNLQKFILTDFQIRASEQNKNFAGIELHSSAGVTLLVTTRQQLLDLASECCKVAETMPPLRAA